MKKEQKKRNCSRRSPKLLRKQQYPDDWVPIQAPPNLEQMYQSWIECEEPNVGWCLLCDSPIRSADDLIPGTNAHNCDAGRSLDEKIHAAERCPEANQKITPTRHQRER